MSDTLDARSLARDLATLLRREHAAAADFLVALARFDEARAWIELGYTSLFPFLHRELGLSRGGAFYRGAWRSTTSCPSRGGASTIENTRLLCGMHNQLAARRIFGERWMRERRAGARSVGFSSGA